jgi:hypothetical protein
MLIAHHKSMKASEVCKMTQIAFLKHLSSKLEHIFPLLLNI